MDQSGILKCPKCKENRVRNENNVLPPICIECHFEFPVEAAADNATGSGTGSTQSDVLVGGDNATPTIAPNSQIEDTPAHINTKATTGEAGSSGQQSGDFTTEPTSKQRNEETTAKLPEEKTINTSVDAARPPAKPSSDARTGQAGSGNDAWSAEDEAQVAVTSGEHGGDQSPAATGAQQPLEQADNASGVAIAVSPAFGANVEEAIAEPVTPHDIDYTVLPANFVDLMNKVTQLHLLVQKSLPSPDEEHESVPSPDEEQESVPSPDEEPSLFGIDDQELIKDARHRLSQMNKQFSAVVKHYNDANFANPNFRELKIKYEDLESLADGLRGPLSPSIQKMEDRKGHEHPVRERLPPEAGKPKKRIEFHALMPKETKTDFKLKVTLWEWSNIPGERRHLIDMEDNDGMLKGVYSAPRTTETLYYRYFIHTTGKRSKAEPECLIKDCRSAFLSDVSDLDDKVTQYDGMICLKKATKSTKVAGYTEMLPKWVERIKAGDSADKLRQQINRATRQQNMHCSTFVAKDEVGDVKRDIANQLRDYLDTTMKKHADIHKDGSVSTGSAYLSMIRLLDLANEHCFDEASEKQLEATADFISKTLLNLFSDTSDHQLCEISQSALSVPDRFHFNGIVLRFITKLSSKKSSSWISVIPLYHALGPINSTTQGTVMTRDSWWGSEGLVEFTAALKPSKGNTWEKWFKVLQPFFKDCTVLPYTFMALLNHDHLHDFLKSKYKDEQQRIPVDAVLARASSRMKDCTPHQAKVKLLEEVLAYIKRMQASQASIHAGSNMDKLADSFLDHFKTKQSWHYKESVDHRSKTHVAINIYLLLVELYIKLESKKPDLARFKTKLLDFVEDFKKCCTDSAPTSFSPGEIQDWGLMFQCAVNTPEIKDLLECVCEQKFDERTEGVTAKAPYHIIELNGNKSFHSPKMKSIIAQSAMSVNGDLLTGESSRHLSEKSSPRTWVLLEKAVADQWTDDDGDGGSFNMVKRLFEHPSTVAICKHVRNQSEDGKMTNPTSAGFQKLTRAVRSFEEVVAKLHNGTIRVDQYKFLTSSKDKLFDLFDALPSLQPQRDAIERLLKDKDRVLTSFDNFHTCLSTFWKSCRHRCMEVDAAVADWLSRDLQTLTFNQLYESAGCKVICDFTGDNPRVNWEEFSSLIQLHIFRSIYQPAMNEADNGWEGVILAYQVSMREYNGIAESIIRGTISIESFEDLCNKYFGGDRKVDLVLDELPKIVPDKVTRAQRRSQMESYFKIAGMSEGADALLLMRPNLIMDEDFAAVERMSSIKAKRDKLCDIDSAIHTNVNRIGKITSGQADCLKAFQECRKFVDWVAETVERNDISVFVNLTSCALGEDAQSNEQTRYLINALNGYAPLIYELKSARLSLDKLLNLCEEVWREEDINHDLPENLRKTAEELEFFERVHNFYGNVELASIAQATAINETGVYYVGNLSLWKTKDQQGMHQPCDATGLLSMDNVIEMKFQQKNEKDVLQEENYGYNRLTSLQSKLTLVAGGKLGASNDFNKMKNAVENLAQAYIDIRREGCVQFDDLVVVIHCNPLVGPAIEISLLNIKEKLFGLLSEEKSALDHCYDVARFLNNCNAKWRDIMDTKRREIPELNYFTTEQLVILRKELGMYWSDQRNRPAESLDKAMRLLAMIHTINPDRLLETMKEFEQLNPTNVEVDNRSPVSYDDMSGEQQDLVAEIKDLHGISDPEAVTRELAVEVVHALGVGEDDEVYVEWVNSRLEALQQELEQKTKQNEATTDYVRKMIIKAEPIGSPLTSKLDTLWDGFIDHTSMSLQNFLSIPHLGHVLKSLEDSKPASRTRTLPDWLERGTPALIAVEERHIYLMVLTIFEADHEATPPSRNNILLCSKSTTHEEVNLFFNRALNDSKSFYCMVNCHLLDIGICQIIERRLTSLVDQNQPKYGLAFIYANEFNNHHIRTYLEKHLVKHSSLAESKELKDYVVLLLAKSRADARDSNSKDPTRLLCQVIRSDSSGVGKSLLTRNRCKERREELRGEDITIPIYRTVDTDAIIKRLTKDLENDYFQDLYHTIHLDVAFEVKTGVDELLFNLIILRSVVDSDGIVWQARNHQHYIIECTPHMKEHENGKRCAHELMELLPTTMCDTPQEADQAYASGGYTTGFDEAVLAQKEWQMVLKYIDAHNQKKTAYKIDVKSVFTNKQKALKLLLNYCGLVNPTWAELNNYVHFLYNQLEKISRSVFCQAESVKTLPGFKPFVVDFMLKLAKDFATRSLVMAEEGNNDRLLQNQPSRNSELDKFTVKTKWEDSSHPYLFINEDGESFTTLGFSVRQSGKLYPLVDLQTQEPFGKDYAISKPLFGALHFNRIPFDEDFTKMSRASKLKRLRRITVDEVPGCTYDVDPDENYVLTMDNAKKIAAIHQRLRVGIPVIIMGETGCGKTKLIEFMSRLQVPEQLHDIQPMITVKIHGGTTEADIIAEVKKAQQLAGENRLQCEKYALANYLKERKARRQEANQIRADAGSSEVAEKVQQILECMRCDKLKANSKVLACDHRACEDCTKRLPAQTKEECLICKKVPKVYTVLFFDEANTTEAIGLIKEILCDGRMDGEPLDKGSGLKIIAACNPYRKHRKEMIEKLEEAGLGHSIDRYTLEKPGEIPLRHLVYRVHPLPQSLISQVWDFGTLKSAPYSEESNDEELNDAESEYIAEMIQKFKIENSEELELDKRFCSSLTRILSRSQTFMRRRDDECSFVSLRDIHRLLDILAWFYKHRTILFQRMADLTVQSSKQNQDKPEPMLLSLLLAIGVCYVARLEEGTRDKYAEYISKDIERLSRYPQRKSGSKLLLEQIELCQQIFVDEVVNEEDHKNIAKNKALRENIFMMVVCIDNRIPLFVIGKPGSSKSLAKSLVFDSMKGNHSKSELFKEMKTIYMESYQCSRHATPAGIVGVFTRCANLQTQQDLSKFVSLVVLDEIGLAEDSKNMPLKALHSWLDVENGRDGRLKPEKCAFIGISNWALDPAKMNRGIFIQRGSFDRDELLKIGSEICASVRSQNPGLANIVEPLADGFLKISTLTMPIKRHTTEFFGLRDYYSLIKMVANFPGEKGQLTTAQLTHSIMRNFGGFDPDLQKPMEYFKEHLPSLNSSGDDHDREPPTNSPDFIYSCLSGDFTSLPGIESRFLLILTEDLGILTIVQDMLKNMRPEVVFGSKFQDDVSFTQICQNIFRIKMCMELGKPVILLNLDSLYESLYDALNQYFSKLGTRQFVDIGLGTHRVKAFINDNFRLIVIAVKNKVFSEFPIPLINRLEKHYVSATTFLTGEQLEVKNRLEEWMKRFVTTNQVNGDTHEDMSVTSVFVGYSLELTALAIRKASKETAYDDMFKRSKFHLLQCATGDSVLRLNRTLLWKDAAELQIIYFQQQHHETLFQYLEYELPQAAAESNLLIQVTTFSQLMRTLDVEDLRGQTQAAKLHVDAECHHLKEFTRESQFTEFLRKFYWRKSQRQSKLLIVQCEFDDQSAELLDIARYIMHRESKDAPTSGGETEDENEGSYVPTHAILLLSVPRRCDFIGYQGGDWKCVHIDDPRSSEFKLPSLNECLECNPSDIIGGLIMDLEADEPPPLEGDENDVLNEGDEEYPDTELYGPRDTELRFLVSNILPFVKHCIPSAMAKIKYSRRHNSINLLQSLLDRDNYPVFLKRFLQLLHSFLTKQEEFNKTHWVMEDAVSESNMKTSETLRHAIEDAFERALVPCMAAIISFIDVQHNLLLLTDDNKFAGLWLQFFEESHLLGLCFNKLSVDCSKLQEAFRIQEVGNLTPGFKLQFPFSWIVKESMERLHGEIANSDLSDDVLGMLFNKTTCGQILNMYMNSINSQQLMDRYIHDFVGMNYPHLSETEHWIIQTVLYRAVKARSNEGMLSPAHVHVLYSEKRDLVDNLADILNIDVATKDGKKAFPEQVKEDIEKEENGTTLMACSLFVLHRGLDALLKSARTEKLQMATLEWLAQMDQVEIIVSHILSFATDVEDCELADKCGSSWEKLQVKKLYAEHVILPSSPDSKNRRKAFNLFKLVKSTECGNFQRYENFQKVVIFLRERDNEGVKSLDRCPICPRPLDRPMKLSCGHLLCENCAKSSRICPDGSCRAIIDSEFPCSPVESHEEQKALKDYKSLRKSLNRFLMHFTSTFVLASTSEPDRELVKWLINQVSMDSGTHKFVFCDSRETDDASPVLRSFLLKLFLRCERNELITASINEMLTTSSNRSLGDQLRTMTILVDCHKDLHNRDRRSKPELSESLSELIESLQHLDTSETREVTVADLKYIAETQYYISNIVDKILSSSEQQPMSDCEDDVKEYFNQIAACGNSQLSYFVMRHIRKRRGEAYIKDLMAKQSYLIPANFRETPSDFIATDILAVYGGEAYARAMDKLDEIVSHSGDESALQSDIGKFYQDTRSSLRAQVLFTKVTRSHSQNTPLRDNVRQTLLKRLPADDRIAQKICQILLGASRMPKAMDVKRAEGVQLSMLVLHLLSVLQEDPGDLNPLIRIVVNPEAAAKHLIPAMRDTRVPMPRKHQKIPSMHGSLTGKDSIMYFCPEGHPYLVGMNGKPSLGKICRCGAVIFQNWPSDEAELGEHSSEDLPHQELSIALRATLRCLVHLFMYTSALSRPQQVMSMVMSIAHPTDLEEFLCQQINKYLDQISQCCEVSTDDCVLLLHDIINRMNTCTERGTSNTLLLSTASERSHWESSFSNKYIIDTLINKDAVISGRKRELASGAQPSSLSRQLDASRDSINSANLLAYPELWQYRCPLTLASVQNKIQHEECPHLKKFVDNCHELIAISYLPDILALIQMLSSRFHSKFRRSKVSLMNANEFCDVYDEKVLNLRGKIEKFIKAWNIMLRTTGGRTAAQIELWELTENSPLAEFLFDIHALHADSRSNNGQTGLTPFILVTLLVDKHNEMLEIDSKARPPIELPRAKRSTFVSLSNGDELLDLVLSHTGYEVGDTSEVTYDWVAVERDLVLRYIGSKPKILLTSDHVPAYMFEEDFNLINQLAAIGDIQERMSPDLEVSITGTLTTNIQKLKDYLKDLQVVINCLAVMPHIDIKRNKSLADFAKTAFESGRDVAYLTPEVQLTHVRHLWFVLKYTQAGQLITQNSEPFDDVEPMYRKGLSDDLKKKLTACCVYNSSITRHLLKLLFELIVLRLNRAATANVEKREPECEPLASILIDFCNGQYGGSLKGSLVDLPALPADLQAKHAAQAWCHIWECYTSPPSDQYQPTQA